MPREGHRRPAAIVLATAVVGSALTSCAGGETCDAEAVAAFEALPTTQGVEVDLHPSPGIGCTDSVATQDPAAFIAHYEQAMRAAGLTVSVGDGATGGDDGVTGRGDGWWIALDPLEGGSVGVYAGRDRPTS